MAKILDLTHVRGDTFSRKIGLSGGLLASGFEEVWFTVRATLPTSDETDDTDALSSGTLTGGEISVTGSSEWTIDIISPNWGVGRLYYDVQVRSGSGQIFTITKGTLRVFDDVTRST